MSQDQYQRYLSFLETDPANLHLLCETARLASSSGDFSAAISLCDRGLALDNSHQELRSIKALSLLSLGQITDAFRIFESLHSVDQHNPVIRYNMAYCLALQGQAAQALHLLADALSHYHAIPQMAHLHIRMLYDLEELDQAVELGRQVLEIDPADGKVHELLSSLYIDNNDFSAAETHAALALQSNPDFALAHTSMGTAALSKQDDLRALQHFEQALNLDQNNGRAWLGKAMTYMLQNRLPEAEQSFETALAQMPEHLGTYQALAWCHISQGNLQAAEQTVNKALAIDDTFSENHGTLAVLAAMQGQLALAQTQAQIAIRLDNACFSGHYARALIAQANGQVDEADQIINAILDSPDIINNLSLRQFITRFRQQGHTLH